MPKQKSSTAAAILGMGVVAFLAVGCEQVSGPSQNNDAARQKAKVESPAKGSGILTLETGGPGGTVSDTGTLVIDTSIQLTEVEGSVGTHHCTGPDSVVVGGSDVVSVDTTLVTVHPTPMDPTHVRPMPQP